jgi:large subunit ribosomal protein L30
MPEDVKNKESKNTNANTEVGSGMIRVQLFRSVIGSSKKQRAVVQGLGLRRMNQVVERLDTPEIRGMVAKVPHLVRVIS